MSDAEAFEYYDDPTNREPAPGATRRRPDRPLSQHVPVRFPTETIEQVRRLAEADGMTVSAWIRRTVDRAVRQQRAPRGELGDDARAVVARLQRDVAELADALDRRAAG